MSQSSNIYYNIGMFENNTGNGTVTITPNVGSANTKNGTVQRVPWDLFSTLNRPLHLTMVQGDSQNDLYIWFETAQGDNGETLYYPYQSTSAPTNSNKNQIGAEALPSPPAGFMGSVLLATLVRDGGNILIGTLDALPDPQEQSESYYNISAYENSTDQGKLTENALLIAFTVAEGKEQQPSWNLPTSVNDALQISLSTENGDYSNDVFLWWIAGSSSNTLYYSVGTANEDNQVSLGTLPTPPQERMAVMLKIEFKISEGNIVPTGFTQ